MSAPASTSSLVGGVGLLERATSYTLGSLLLVTSEDLQRQTPCDGWTLRTLLHHMNDSLAALHEAAETGHVGLRPLGADAALPEIVDSLRDRACRLMGAWTSVSGRDIGVADLGLAAPVVAAAGAIEVSVHGWDVSVACGRPRDIPESLAHDLIDLARLLVTDEDRPARFAPPIPAPAAASPGERLLAWLGRDRPADQIP